MTQPSNTQPSSQVIDGPNSPVNNNSSGWSNNYIAAIILVPLGVGAAIFVAVFFLRKKKQRRVKENALKNKSNATQFTMPLTELRGDKSMTYDTVPDTPSTDRKRTTSKYVPITLIDNKNITDRLCVPYSELKFKKELGAGAYGKVFIGGKNKRD